jgi:hypothetical protein
MVESIRVPSKSLLWLLTALVVVYGAFTLKFNVFPVPSKSDHILNLRSDIPVLSNEPPLIALSGFKNIADAEQAEENNFDAIKFSFIYASRNDNYEGHPSSLRLEASLKALYTALDKFNLTKSSEVLVVDWASEQPLEQSEPVKRLRPTACTRWLFISSQVLSTLNILTEHMSEVHALNAAARRARGDTIFRLDQDTVVSPVFFEWVASQPEQFDGEVYALLGRRDSNEQQREVILQDPWGYVSNSTFMQDTRPWAGVYDFANGHGAVGVMIFSKSLWLKLQGYNEDMTGWGHMEIDLWRRAQAIKPAMDRIGLLDSLPAVHIHHERFYKKPLNDFPNTEAPPLENPSFGFGDVNLFETRGRHCVSSLSAAK